MDGGRSLDFGVKFNGNRSLTGGQSSGEQQGRVKWGVAGRRVEADERDTHRRAGIDRFCRWHQRDEGVLSGKKSRAGDEEGRQQWGFHGVVGWAWIVSVVEGVEVWSAAGPLVMRPAAAQSLLERRLVNQTPGWCRDQVNPAPLRLLLGRPERGWREDGLGSDGLAADLRSWRRLVDPAKTTAQGRAGHARG